MRKIDEKHHLEGEQIIKTGNGVPVPESEPLILFRARDNLALPALHYYKQLCIEAGCTDYQMASLQSVINKFSEFAATSPTMKQPGITLGK